MLGSRHIIVRVQYERHRRYGRSLGWIAPELKDASMTMTEDRTDDPTPSRTWEGTLDGPTFTRFARAWHLPECDTDVPSFAADRASNPAPRPYTLDGMNWDAHGQSPIVCVTVQVARTPGTEEVCTS
jgi:hypothetical protein